MDILKELESDLLKLRYIERRDLYGEGHDLQYKGVLYCAKCDEMLRCWDDRALMHIWNNHEIRPRILREKVREYLFSKALIGI